MNHPLIWSSLSCLLSLALLFGRIEYAGKTSFIFLVWNLFLAALPLLFSSIALKCAQHGSRWIAIAFLLPWLLFLPNAPYILTDLLHLKQRLPVPMWYDLLLLLSFSLNGLFLGYLSLRQVEELMRKFASRTIVAIAMFISLFLAAYGIYLGRFLRLNSWDVWAEPKDTAYHILRPVIDPFEHPRTWVVTLILGFMLWFGYQMVRALAMPDMRKG
jgi:uncharacterized membrane protein